MSATKVTPEMVKTLRERTGVGMAKCKEALDQAGGNMELAIDNLRKAGAASAVKKSDRATNEGLIGFADEQHAVALIEVNAETDFVTKNEKFIHFVEMFAKDAAKSKASSLEHFMNEKSYDGKHTHEELRVELIQTIGENIQIKQLVVIPKVKGHSYGLYKHMGGKIVTMAEIKGSDHAEKIAKDVAMHIAAEAPEYLKPDEVPQDVIAREEDIAKSQVKNKPPEITQKIVDGKIKAFYDQVCLIGQKYIKDNSLSVAQYVESEGKKMNVKLEIVRFLRWQVGVAG